jgi:uncharacterized membrane-anchored protein YitT (DUF2179 family)
MRLPSNLSLALTGFFQVAFVAMNTVFLADRNLPGVLAASFLISLIWSYNVKRVVFGSIRDRLAYAVGASLGAGAGMGIADLMVKLF